MDHVVDVSHDHMSIPRDESSRACRAFVHFASMLRVVIPAGRVLAAGHVTRPQMLWCGAVQPAGEFDQQRFATPGFVEVS